MSSQLLFQNLLLVHKKVYALTKSIFLLEELAVKQKECGE